MQAYRARTDPENKGPPLPSFAKFKALKARFEAEAAQDEEQEYRASLVPWRTHIEKDGLSHLPLKEPTFAEWKAQRAQIEAGASYYEPPGRGTAHYERTPRRAAYERPARAPDLTGEEP
jgi:hypothetical protein